MTVAVTVTATATAIGAETEKMRARNLGQTELLDVQTATRLPRAAPISYDDIHVRMGYHAAQISAINCKSAHPHMYSVSDCRSQRARNGNT